MIMSKLKVFALWNIAVNKINSAYWKGRNMHLKSEKGLIIKIYDAFTCKTLDNEYKFSKHHINQ